MTCYVSSGTLTLLAHSLHFLILTIAYMGKYDKLLYYSVICVLHQKMCNFQLSRTSITLCYEDVTA